MHIFSLIAHPRADSFCHAMSDRARRKLAVEHQITHHDLYAEGFDPCLTASEAYTSGSSQRASVSSTLSPMV
ncbi:MAG: NAD(P)H-dependent oxidoreductase [Pseudomonadota bacterium]